ncbi:MAG TPA: hypothetical protein VGI10_17625 [Polyangiaceae bacterium]|jgi:hypothetical protein
MTRAQTPQGDSHNFGRRVARRGARVQKPRTLLWEWLLLSAKSPLRRLLADAAEREGLARDAFGFLPTLRFFSLRARAGGEVERVALSPLGALSNGGKRELATIVGRSLGLFGWLGVADLHWENLVLGRDARGRIVFGPLDVEMILADLASPTETKLLPDADPEYAAICRHACGVRRVLPYLGKPIRVLDLLAMLDGYRETLALLDRHASAIAQVFARLPGLRETPIRVCLRGTDEYVRARSAPLWPPLLEAEVEQLARDDIPYFFRLYGRRGIHYYGDRALRRLERIPSQGDAPALDPLLQLSRGLRSPSRRKLREEGLFTLLGAFDHASFSGRHASDSFRVAFGARRIAVRLPSGEELETRRDLSAFVGSVYLPCHCGEVRSVFVPSVTTCDGGSERLVRARTRPTF